MARPSIGFLAVLLVLTVWPEHPRAAGVLDLPVVNTARLRGRFSRGSWRAVTSNGTTLVAVGNAVSGSAGAAAASTDGVHWTPGALPSPSGGYWNGVTWSGSKFVAVGGSGSTTPIVATSSDGLTWSSLISPSLGTGTFNTVIAKGSTLVAMGYLQCALSGNDGATWTACSSMPSGYNWLSVTWDGDHSKFVAVGSSSAAATGSSDGNTWTIRTITSGVWKSVVWTGNKFVAVGTNATQTAGKITTSGDGASWTDGSIPGDLWSSVAWNGSYLTAVGPGAAALSDGDTGGTWKPRPLTTYGGNWKAVTAHGSAFIAVGVDTNGSTGMSAPLKRVRDDFSGSSLASYTVDTGATWSLIGGVLKASQTQTSVESYCIRNDTGPFRDGIIQINNFTSSPGGKPYARVYFRYQGPGRNLRIEDDSGTISVSGIGGAYLVGNGTSLCGGGNAYCQLGSVAYARTSTLTRIVYSGPTVQIYVDGASTPQLTVTDLNVDVGWAGIGVYTGGFGPGDNYATFDNLDIQW